MSFFWLCPSLMTFECHFSSSSLRIINMSRFPNIKKKIQKTGQKEKWNSCIGRESNHASILPLNHRCLLVKLITHACWLNRAVSLCPYNLTCLKTDMPRLCIILFYQAMLSLLIELLCWLQVGSMAGKRHLNFDSPWRFLLYRLHL
jgi:hypothetical protein